MSIAIEVVSWWGMRGHRCDFLMYAYLIFPNAFELFLKVWPPECEVHDTNPVQLLSCKCCLPMDRVVGMSVWVVVNSRYLWLNLLNLSLDHIYGVRCTYILLPHSDNVLLLMMYRVQTLFYKALKNVCSIFARYFLDIFNIYVKVNQAWRLKNEEPMDYRVKKRHQWKSGQQWYDTCLIYIYAPSMITNFIAVNICWQKKCTS